MTKIYAFILVLTVSSYTLSAQDQYQVLSERPNEKTLKGIINRASVQNDSSFSWYASNLKGYNPNTEAVAGLKTHADSLQLIVFLGTWCSDSHNIIPKFFALTDAASLPENKITLIGVDRKKKTIGYLTEALNVKNVPTIIVMKNGKEVGRVVEYGKYGMFDKELGEIINKMGK